jgi:hypothetical protein
LCGTVVTLIAQQAKLPPNWWFRLPWELTGNPHRDR